MQVKYLGISNLCFDDGQSTILFDACLSRPSLGQIIFNKIGTNRQKVNDVLQNTDINKIDAIFISHSHYDHALDLGYLAQKFGSKVYGSSSTINIAKGAGIKQNKLVQFYPNSVYQIGNFKITILKSIHSKPFFFNNDLGQKIKEPLKEPCREWQFKEGGSYDFLIENRKQTYLIRPSFGYVPKELKNRQADYLFLGSTTLSRENKREQQKFFEETITQVKPQAVVPLHWDNFFRPLNKSTQYLPFARKSDELIKNYCMKKGIKFILMPPLSSINF